MIYGVKCFDVKYHGHYIVEVEAKTRFGPINMETVKLSQKSKNHKTW